VAPQPPALAGARRAPATGQQPATLLLLSSHLFLLEPRWRPERWLPWQPDEVMRRRHRPPRRRTRSPMQECAAVKQPGCGALYPERARIRDGGSSGSFRATAVVRRQNGGSGVFPVRRRPTVVRAGTSRRLFALFYSPSIRLGLGLARVGVSFLFFDLYRKSIFSFDFFRFMTNPNFPRLDLPTRSALIPLLVSLGPLGVDRRDLLYCETYLSLLLPSTTPA